MASIGLVVFDKIIHKTNTLLRGIEIELGWEKHRNLSYAALDLPLILKQLERKEVSI